MKPREIILQQCLVISDADPLTKQPNAILSTHLIFALARYVGTKFAEFGYIFVALIFLLLASTAQAQSVTALTCSPSTIGGGTGSPATCTVTLGSAAPAGGTVVTLTSSLTELVASVPTITIPAGQTLMNFSVGTNPHYRRYSLLPFTATITATANATSQSATLNITAQQRPADFITAEPAGSTQPLGLLCGGINIAGEMGILYECSVPDVGFGLCVFRQECLLGCRMNGSNSFCATTGPNPIAVSRNRITSGDHVLSTVVLEAPAVTAPPSTSGNPLTNFSSNAGIPPTNGGLIFPPGASSVGFTVGTSYVPTIEFVNVAGYWIVGNTNARAGNAWIAMVPPNPPPSQPIPTPIAFKITGINPATGGQSSGATIYLSGASPGGGPTITLTSSHPAIASVPASVTKPAGETFFGIDVPITTQPPAENTNVTITSTDGRHSFGATLMVLAPGPAPVLAGVSVNPSSVVGGNTSIGTVTLSAAQSGVTVVTLDEPFPATVAQHPTSVSVPAGQTSANFTITTAPRTEADGTFNLNIYARLSGSPTRQTLLLITPSAAPTATLATLSLSPSGVVGGNPSTGTVTLSAAAPSGGAAVTLTSSNEVQANFTVSPLIVPAGATSATFTVNTRSTITATTTATISGTFNGTTRSATLTVSPPPPPPPGIALSSFSVSPSSVAGGTSSIGTVRLSAAAPAGGVLVSLGSQLPGSASVPTSVTVAAGATSANFTITTFNVSATAVSLTAHLGDVILYATLTVNSPTSSQLNTLTLNPTSVVGGNSSIGTASLSATRPESVTVRLSTGSAIATVPASVTIPANSLSASFNIATTSVAASTPVVITAVPGPITQNTQTAVLTVTPPVAATLSAISVNPTSVVGSNTSTGTVTLSAAAPSGGAVISLSDNSTAATVPASVTMAAGATSATFTITTSTVTASTSATLSAVYGGTTRTATLTVTAVSGTLPAPTLLSPANDTRFSRGTAITLDWSDVSGAASYTVEIDNSSTIAAPLTATQTVTASQMTINTLPAQKMWWRVRANSTAGVAGAWSTVRRFEVR